MQARAKAVGRIDHQRQGVLHRDRLQGGDIARVTEVVTSRDGNRARRDGGGHRLRHGIGCDRINVDKDRAEVVPNDRRRTGQKRKARDNDFAHGFVAAARSHDAKA